MERDDFNSFIKEMVSCKFFMEICSFTKEEREQKEDWIALTKGMLLLDVYCNLKWTSEDVSDGGLIEYLMWARESYDDSQKNTLRSVLEYLEEAFFDTRESLYKEIIPSIIVHAGRAMYEEIKPDEFLKI